MSETFKQTKLSETIELSSRFLGVTRARERNSKARVTEIFESPASKRPSAPLPLRPPSLYLPLSGQLTSIVPPLAGPDNKYIWTHSRIPFQGEVVTEMTHDLVTI